MNNLLQSRNLNRLFFFHLSTTGRDSALSTCSQSVSTEPCPPHTQQKKWTGAQTELLFPPGTYVEEALFPFRGWADTCMIKAWLRPLLMAGVQWLQTHDIQALSFPLCSSDTETTMVSQVPLLLEFASSQEGMWMQNHAKSPQWSAASLELALTQEQLQC